ncbi:MAG: cupin domain-containing protein, partial [Armatimonadetes bacterium]|nr:cupin domain-containing protein [Armatimonadota bacterium]
MAFPTFPCRKPSRSTNFSPPPSAWSNTSRRRPIRLQIRSPFRRITPMDAAILSAQEQRAAYSARLRAAHLKEGYSYDDDGKFQTRPYWPLEPVNRVKPHLWKWSEVRALVQGAGELVGLGRGSVSYDRRVLALTNPGLDGEYSLSGTLFGDIQLIQPGEGAPCHRHTPCAARFIFEGQGWTTVEGERTSLAPGDVVFTGQFTWHDHGNAGDTDLMFLDVLDIPLLQYLAASVWEFDYERVTGSAENRHHPTQTMN